MKSLLFSMIVFVAGSFSLTNAMAEPADVDFNKVNKVISGIADSLIEGDDLVTSLSGSFDPEATNLAEKRMKGQLGASVNRTLWSPTESSLQLNASLESTASNQYEETVDVKLGGVLKTAVVSLVQYAFEKAGCAVTEEDRIPTVYTHLGNEICPVLNERVPALQGIEDLIQLVVETDQSVRSQIDSYIYEMTKKRKEADDDSIKELLRVFIYSANSLKSEMKRLSVEQNQNSLTITFSLDEIMDQPLQGQILSQISGDQFDLGLELAYQVSKDVVDDAFMWATQFALGLQSESEEMIEDVTSMLRSYLELVKSTIAE